MSTRLQIVAVGRLRDPFAGVADLYLRRLGPGLDVRVDEVAPEPASRDRGRAMRREGERLRGRLQDRAWRVALTPECRPPDSSEALADWLALRIEAARPISILIGGADGIEPGLRRECEERLSLGPLTLPHQLARVVLLEQLYRAVCIRSGHPYPR